MGSTECISKGILDQRYHFIKLPFLMVYTDLNNVKDCTCTTKLQAVRPQFLCTEEPNTASR